MAHTFPYMLHFNQVLIYLFLHPKCVKKLVDENSKSEIIVKWTKTDKIAMGKFKTLPQDLADLTLTAKLTQSSDNSRVKIISQ